MSSTAQNDPLKELVGLVRANTCNDAGNISQRRSSGNRVAERVRDACSSARIEALRGTGSSSANEIACNTYVTNVLKSLGLVLNVQEDTKKERGALRKRHEKDSSRQRLKERQRVEAFRVLAHLAPSDIVLALKRGDDVFIESNIQGAFAMESFDLEALAERLKSKIGAVIAADGSSSETFSRFCDPKRQGITPSRFARMVHLVMRNQLPPITQSELEYALFRYMDPLGCGLATLNDFERFASAGAQMPQVLEHGTWMSGRALSENASAIVDVITLAVPPQIIEQERLAKMGFVRALGEDVGVWVKRARVDDYASEEEFRRACISEVLCLWESAQKGDLEGIKRDGFVAVQKQRARRGIRLGIGSNHGFKTKIPLLFVRRNAKNKSPIFDLSFGFTGGETERGLGGPPCHGFHTDLGLCRGRIDHITRRKKVFKTSWRKRPVMFVRRLKWGSGNGLQALEDEFSRISSKHDTSKIRKLAAQRAEQATKRFEQVKLGLRLMLAKQFFALARSPECLTPDALPDTELLLEEADKNRVGWLSRSAVESVLGRLGLNLDPAMSDLVLEHMFASKKKNPSSLSNIRSQSNEAGASKNGRVGRDTVAQFFLYNPSRAQQLILAIVYTNPDKVRDFVKGQNESDVNRLCSQQTFLALLKDLLAGTDYEYKSWDFEQFPRLFVEKGHVSTGKNKSHGKYAPLVDLRNFSQVLMNFLTCAQKQDAAREHDLKTGQTLRATIEISHNNANALDFLKKVLGGPNDDAQQCLESLSGRKNVEKISLARLKSEVRKRTRVSDDGLECLVSRAGLANTPFIGRAEIVHARSALSMPVANRKWETKAKQTSPTSPSTDSEESDDESVFSASSSSSTSVIAEDDEEENTPWQEKGEHKFSALFPSSKSLARHRAVNVAAVGDESDWIEIRRCFATSRGGFVREMLFSSESSSISEAHLRNAISEAKLSLSAHKVQVLFHQARYPENPDWLSRNQLIKALWPRESTALVSWSWLDSVLERAQRVVTKAIESGVDPHRIKEDIILFGVDESDTSKGAPRFDEEHLVSLLRRLSSGCSALENIEPSKVAERIFEKTAQRDKKRTLLDATVAFLCAKNPDDEQLVAGKTVARPSALSIAKTNLSFAARASHPESDGPLFYFKRKDLSGVGSLSRADFQAALRSLAPALCSKDVQTISDWLTESNSGRVRYDTSEFLLALTSRPRSELEIVFSTVQRVRVHFQQRMRVSRSRSFEVTSPMHHWALFKRADESGTGNISKRQFRATLCDEIGFSLSESQLQLLMRWFRPEPQSDGRSAQQVDYERFCRAASPAVAQIQTLMSKLHWHLCHCARMPGPKTELRGRLEECDIFATGYITRKTLRTICFSCNLCPQVLTEHELDLVVDAFDINGGDRFDYVAFWVSLISGGTKHSTDQMKHMHDVARAARREILRLNHYSPHAAFEIFDPTGLGSVSQPAFLDACHKLYIPGSPDDLIGLANFMGHVARDGQLAYGPFLNDLVRNAGPDGAFCNLGVPVKGSDATWNSSNVQAFLRDESVPLQRKEKLVQVCQGIARNEFL